MRFILVYFREKIKKTNSSKMLKIGAKMAKNEF